MYDEVRKKVNNALIEEKWATTVKNRQNYIDIKGKFQNIQYIW